MANPLNKSEIDKKNGYHEKDGITLEEVIELAKRKASHVSKGSSKNINKRYMSYEDLIRKFSNEKKVIEVLTSLHYLLF